jgi:hypothetical protein
VDVVHLAGLLCALLQLDPHLQVEELAAGEALGLGASYTTASCSCGKQHGAGEIASEVWC